MTEQLQNGEAAVMLKGWLNGASFDKFSYFITGWELRFLGGEAGEYLLNAAELTVPDTDAWSAALLKTPIDLSDTNKPTDVLVGAQLFSVINQWRVDEVEIGSSGSLSIMFENSVRIDAPAKVELVDWTWSVTSNGDFKTVTCDSGPIYLSNLVVS